jgi:uncharacterized protein
VVDVADRVVATDAALAAIGGLTAAYGKLMLFQSGGCCDGSSPICLPAGDLQVGPHDVLLGEVSGATFYIDDEQYERWNRPQLVLDVAEGAAEGFSLEGLKGIHFVTRSAASPAKAEPGRASGGAVVA